MHRKFRSEVISIRPIRTRADYRAALREIELLMPAKAKSPDGERLDSLVTLVQAYEAKRYPMTGRRAA